MEIEDKEQIDGLVKTFFNAFNNRGQHLPQLAQLEAIFTAPALIIKTCGQMQTYTLAEFIAPRQDLLENGRLREFAEWEEEEETKIFGDIAQRICRYAKQGILDGENYAGRGVKSMQFVRTEQGWKISTVLWDDEREGFALPHSLRQSTN